MSIPSTIVGSFLSTGAAINVELGFVPGVVRFVNQTTGKTLTWYSTMNPGSGLVGGAGTTAALITTNGVSAYDGATAGRGFGFTLGTDGINPAGGNVIAYEASRSGPGGK